MLQKPRGTMDILPEEVHVWQFIEKKAREVAARYGFSEIRFPAFESTELFCRGVGDTTDVVQKEMYTFTDRDNRSLTLRPEGTASVVRSLIENGKCSDTMPLKLFYLINCFRYEKPQAGRSREFFQFGVELFGASSPAADAEVIALGAELLRELGVTGVVLKINSIGCPECRPAYRDALRSYFKEHESELCDTCRVRLESNPLRILDCKSPICSALAEKAPKTLEHLCDDCKAHMDTLCAMLDDLNIQYVIDPKIVRGLDYYNRTVFEFTAENIGAQSAVGGGGRYDGLVEQLGGPKLAGLGFAMGITRIILAMNQSGVLPEKNPGPALYIASMGDAAKQYAVRTAAALRSAGIHAECDIVGRSLKAQMKYADKIGAKYTVVVGDNELNEDKAVLKNMRGGEPLDISLSDTEALKTAVKA